MIFNGFIAAREGNSCIKYWMDTVLKVWQGVTTVTGINQNPLLFHLPKYERPTLLGQQPPFTYKQYVNYICQIFCLEPLRHVIDPSVDWNGPKYFADKFLSFDCVKEVYWAQRITMWDGRKQFDLLASAREIVEHDEKWKEAEEFVEGILRTSSTMKISHGLPTPGREYLSEIWDQKANWNNDNEPSSWGEYLRWASVHFEQTALLEKVSTPTWEASVIVGGITKWWEKEDRIDRMDRVVWYGETYGEIVQKLAKIMKNHIPCHQCV